MYCQYFPPLNCHFFKINILATWFIFYSCCKNIVDVKYCLKYLQLFLSRAAVQWKLPESMQSSLLLSSSSQYQLSFATLPLEKDWQEGRYLVSSLTLCCQALFCLSCKYIYIFVWKVGRAHNEQLLIDLTLARPNGCHNWPVFCKCGKGNRCFGLLETDYEQILVIIFLFYISNLSSLEVAADSIALP